MPNRLSEQVLEIVAELYNQKFTKENSLNGILLYPIKSVNNFVDPVWKQEMESKKKAAWEDYRKLEKEVEEQIKIKNEPNLALLEEKIKQYSIFLDSIEDLLNEMDELSDENDLENEKKDLLEKKKEFEVEIENLNQQRSQIRNQSLEEKNLKLAEKSKVIDEISKQQQPIYDQAKQKLMAYTKEQLSKIKNALTPNQYIGLVLQNPHIEGLILSKDKIVRVSSGSGSLPYPMEEILPTVGLVYQTIQNKTQSRMLQADAYNCATFVLKMLKTLLSKNQKGSCLFDTLQINPKNPLELLLPADLAKMSQSQFLVDEIFPNHSSLTLTVGKHRGKKLNDFRSSHQTEEGNQYIKKVFDKYNGFLDPKILIQKLQKINPDLAAEIEKNTSDIEKIQAFLNHPSQQKQQFQEALKNTAMNDLAVQINSSQNNPLRSNVLKP